MSILKATSFNVTLYLRIWAGLFGGVGLFIVVFEGFSVYLLYGAVGCLGAAIPLYLVISWCGEIIGSLMFWGKSEPPSASARFAALFDKARHGYRTGDYRLAQREITTILTLDPDNSEALIWKARIVLVQTGDRRHAAVLLRRALRNSAIEPEHKSWARTLLSELGQETNEP